MLLECRWARPTRHVPRRPQVCTRKPASQNEARSKGRGSGTYMKFLLLRQFQEGCVSPQTKGGSLPVCGGQVQGPPGKAGCVLPREGVSGFGEQPEHNELELEKEEHVRCDRLTEYPCDMAGCSRAARRPCVTCGGLAKPSRGTQGPLQAVLQ